MGWCKPCIGIGCSLFVKFGFRASPPILALILEKTSLSQKAPMRPPVRSPLSRAAFLEAYAASNSLRLMGLLAWIVAVTLSYILFHNRGTEQNMWGFSSCMSSSSSSTLPLQQNVHC